MTFKLLKRRYRSSEESEKMRRLEYFSHPYEPDNSICLIDDLYLPKSISVYSLASEFSPNTGEQKRGKKNMTDRPKETSKCSLDLNDFGNFDMDNSDYL